MDSINKQTEILSKFCLEDRIAVVTGSGRGIGEEIALAFAGIGAHIVVAELDTARGEATADKVRSLERKALPISVDTTDAHQVQKMVEEALRVFGRIDILVNNVGGGGQYSMMAPLFDLPEESWDSAINNNLKSTFLCTKLVGLAMKDQKKGNMINIASAVGKRPYPLMAQYGAAKAGIIHFTKSMAVYLAPYGIRVNGIAPGLIATPAISFLGDPQKRAERSGIPLGRPGYPEDVSLTAIYLASEASDYITGVVIDVCGGPYLGNVLLRQAEETWNLKK